VRSRSRWVARVGLALALLAAAPRPAHAWDPSTTHMGLVDRGLRASAVHLRWMDASEGAFGAYTSLRVNPQWLDDEQRRWITRALRAAHATSGAAGLGGPGACPGGNAPLETQRLCVQGDIWELSAVGWIKLGVIAETVPRERLLHHFVDRSHPQQATWLDPRVPAAMLRARLVAGAEAPLAGVGGRPSRARTGPSAIAWLQDPRDRLAPTAMAEHLRLAALDPDPARRMHHRALALLCFGALLHVAQDLSVPAHARGDVWSFFQPLSAVPRDRGLPLQEIARRVFPRADVGDPLLLSPRASAAARRAPTGDGDEDEDEDEARELDDAPADGAAPGTGAGATTSGRATPGGDERPAGQPLARSLLAHLVGEGGTGGIVALAATRFPTEASLPPPRAIAPERSASEAASELLAGLDLDPVELEGAYLQPWPADRGYVVSATGRALAAFDTDVDGRLRPYLDVDVLRSQARALLPRAAELTTSLFDFVWPAPLALEGPPRGPWRVTVPPGVELSEGEVIVLAEDPDGRRRELARAPVRGDAAAEAVRSGPAAGETGPVRLAAAAGLAPTADGERIVAVLVGQRAGGDAVVLEGLLRTAPSPARPTPVTRPAVPPTGSPPPDRGALLVEIPQPADAP
jgi:hypothetical protein